MNLHDVLNVFKDLDLWVLWPILSSSLPPFVHL